MKLDTDEEIIHQLQADTKILVPWFFTKTILYSLAVIFFIFMFLFFANTVSVLSTEADRSAESVEISTATDQAVNDSNNADRRKKVEHPFKLMLQYWLWAVVIAVISMIVIQVYLVYLRKTYQYIITTKRCVFIGGILKRVERSVPYKKVTDIQRTQNILERILGIWNVQVFTPGTASMAVGQRKAQAELNFDGLVNSEEAMEAINKQVQECV